MKIILTAHGHCASGLIEAVEMILGPLPESVIAVDFGPNDTIQLLTDRIVPHLDPDMTYVFCDIKGGTPFNASYLLSKNHPMTIICGMNLGMMLECLIKFVNESDEPIGDIAATAGKAAIEVFNLD